MLNLEKEPISPEIKALVPFAQCPFCNANLSKKNLPSKFVGIRCSKCEYKFVIYTYSYTMYDLLEFYYEKIYVVFSPEHSKVTFENDTMSGSFVFFPLSALTSIDFKDLSKLSKKMETFKKFNDVFK